MAGKAQEPHGPISHPCGSRRAAAGLGCRRDRGPHLPFCHMLWPCLALTWLYGSPWSWRQNQGPWTPLPLTAFPFALSTSAQNHLSSARDLPCVSAPEHPSQSISGGMKQTWSTPCPLQERAMLGPHGARWSVSPGSSIRPWGGEEAVEGAEGRARVDSRCQGRFQMPSSLLPSCFFPFFLWQNIHNINFILTKFLYN